MYLLLIGSNLAFRIGELSGVSQYRQEKIQKEFQMETYKSNNSLFAVIGIRITLMNVTRFKQEMINKHFKMSQHLFEFSLSIPETDLSSLNTKKRNYIACNNFHIFVCVHLPIVRQYHHDQRSCLFSSSLGFFHFYIGPSLQTESSKCGGHRYSAAALFSALLNKFGFL